MQFDAEKALRMEWWLNHGRDCMPYGDDGEMQCCVVDFKREPLAELSERVMALRRHRFQQEMDIAAVTCQWAEDEDAIWATECGQAFEFNESGPVANGLKFCGYCGKTLTEIRYVEPVE